MLAAFNSPSSATKAPALASLSRVVQCAFVEDDAEPSLFDFPIQASIGSSKFASYVGSGLVSTLTLAILPVLVSLLFALVGWRCQYGRAIQKKVLANWAIAAFGYFGPVTFKVPLLVILHSSEALDAVLGVLCPLLVCAITVALLFAVVRRFDLAVNVLVNEEGKTRKALYQNAQPNSLFVETFGLLFDAARSPRLIHRLLYFEDFLVAAALQLLEGARP